MKVRDKDDKRKMSDAFQVLEVYRRKLLIKETVICVI